MCDNSALALLGGDPIITYQIPRYNSIGKEEIAAVNSVLETGILSDFLASWGPNFYGGSKVQEFEKKCTEYFKVNHAIAVNSWTSGLVCAVGAIGVEPGDEVIVSPWTMSASAISILHWNAIPVFADIDPDTYCIDPQSILKNISNRTKAIIVVDIFGQSANYVEINKIAKKFNLKVICDTAQAPGGLSMSLPSGTQGDIGGFSLNYHKHINTGEGGILVTNDDRLADNMRLIRNHAESIVEEKKHHTLVNMIGHNFRMGEIEAAIGMSQLNKLRKLVSIRQSIASQITIGLSGLKGLTLPKTAQGNEHVYYKYAMQIDPMVLEVDKFKIIEALKTEGVPGLSSRYVNVHLLPIFQNKMAYGSKGFPWISEFTSREIAYNKGICPVAEDLQDNRFFSLDLCGFEFQVEDIDLIIEAFKKVWRNLGALKKSI